MAKRVWGCCIILGLSAFVITWSARGSVSVVDEVLPNARFVSLEGNFTMGSPGREPGRELTVDDENAHRVELTSFAIQETEVTQEQWESIMDYNPSTFRGASRPVETVSWHETQDFVDVLNFLAEKRGLTHRYGLPTEAQWEFAARGGTQTAYFFGNDPSLLRLFSIFADNAGDQTQPVGTRRAGFAPNQFGLYDMLGNVWEWTRDLYMRRYEKLPNRNPTREASWTTGEYDVRVAKGGGWDRIGLELRCARRLGIVGSVRLKYVGFRLVRINP